MSFLAVVMFFAAAFAALAEPIDVDTQVENGTVRLSAMVFIEAPPEEVWAVLTDYDNQARFLPGVTASRVVARNERGSIVDQRGALEVMFLRFDFDLEYSTDEMPPLLLTSHLIRGSLKRLNSEYRLSRSDTGTNLVFKAELEPKGWLFPVFGPMLIRHHAASQIEAMVQEVARRRMRQKP